MPSERELMIGGTRYSSEKMVNEILSNRGVPPRYFKAQFDDDICMPIDSDYYVYGLVGVGKTHFLCSLLRQHPNTDSCLFISYDDLLENLKSGFGHKKTDEEGEQVLDSFLSKYKEVQVLAIDDIGSGLVTDWAKAILFQIINYRYNHLLRTYISSNFSLEALGNIFDNRVASRLDQTCKLVELKKYKRTPDVGA